MQLKYKDQVLNIGQDMWDAMNKHAHERDMTIDAYIAEAFTKLRDSETLSKQMQDNLEPITHPTEYDESDDIEMAKSLEQQNDKTNV